MSPDQSPERRAAVFASNLSIESIDEVALEQALDVIMDSIAAIVAGADTDTTDSFTGLVGHRYPGSASVLGTANETMRYHAALANGTAGTVLELDEGHKFAAGHPAMHVLPAVLAETEVCCCDGATLLEGFIPGYEIAARAGIACQPLRDPYHMHGLWGTVGGAAAIARVRGFDADRTLDAMRIGANHALHTRFDAAQEGATVRNTYAGMSNMNAVVACDQAKAGFTGLEGGVGRHLDRVCGETFSPDVLADGLGERWEVTRGYFKCHAACRYTHGALDAVQTLQEEHSLTATDCRSVRVETFDRAATLDETRPESSLAAKFSIPFAVATKLVRGESGKTAFAPDALTDATYEVAKRVTVEASPELEARTPDSRSTRVSVETVDKDEFVELIEHAQGDQRNPFPTGRLGEKFHSLVDPMLGRERATYLRDAVIDLPETDAASVCSLASLDS